MKPTLLFISCEHAVNTIPAAYRNLFLQQEDLLQTHRAMDFGALDMAVYLSQTLGCAYTKATVSRLLIDCNRSITHPHCFSEFTQQLTTLEKQQLINRYYLPYRQDTEHQIKTYIENGYQVFHLSSHSFTPVFNDITRNAGIGLLYDPKHHGEKEVAREWHGVLSQQTPYRVRKNYPYEGSSDGFTSYLRKKYSEKDYLGFELEVNQAIVQDSASFDAVANAISESLRELLQLL